MMTMEMPAYLQGRAGEIMATELLTAESRGMWAVILGLKPCRDGDQWCILWGDNLQAGVAGFGASPVAAIQDFQRAMYTTLEQGGQRP